MKNHNKTQGTPRIGSSAVLAGESTTTKMKINAPRTLALIGEITNNPGLEWTRDEIQQLGDQSIQIETDLNELREAADKLNEIVEGVRNRRWAADGIRLKDTPEWCAFYCALKRTAEPANDQAHPQPAEAVVERNQKEQNEK